MYRATFIFYVKLFAGLCFEKEFNVNERILHSTFEFGCYMHACL